MLPVVVHLWYLSLVTLELIIERDSCSDDSHVTLTSTHPCANVQIKHGRKVTFSWMLPSTNLQNLYKQNMGRIIIF